MSLSLLIMSPLIVFLVSKYRGQESNYYDFTTGFGPAFKNPKNTLELKKDLHDGSVLLKITLLLSLYYNYLSLAFNGQD